MHPLGSTRSKVRHDHAVLGLDSHVRSPLPGWSQSSAIVLISPRMGAQFGQLLVEMGAGARAGLPKSGVERFIWIVEGSASLELDGHLHELGPGSYALIPPNHGHQLVSTGGARVMLVEKPYVPLDGVEDPVPIVGREDEVAPVALLGDEDLHVRVLIPETPEHDLAMNTMTFAPGAALPFVEVHSMEHGLLMLSGTMVYRLGEEWHLLQAGDVVYMAPYCPQWATAYGKTPAKYLLYKDWNRDPLMQP